MTSLSSRALPEPSFAKASGGGHDWDRTSDPTMSTWCSSAELCALVYVRTLQNRLKD